MPNLRDFLAEVSTEPQSLPTAMVLYAPPGLGKTSIAAAIPGVVFAVDRHELGIETLKKTGQVPADVAVLPAVGSWGDLMAMLSQLAKKKHDFKTLAIDTLGGLQLLLFDHVRKTKFHDDLLAFNSYGKGVDASLVEWRKLLDAFDDCRRAGMSVVCLAHSATKEFKNPEGDNYERFVPDLHAKVWSLTSRWADMILYGGYDVEVTDAGKGRGGKMRYLKTEWSPAYEAKHRHGLPSEVSMGRSGAEAWANLTNALAKGRKE